MGVMVQSVTRYVDLPPVWTLLFMGAAAVLAQMHAPYHGALAVFGAILMVVAVAIMLWAVYHLRRADTAVMPGATPRALVRTGPYRHSRNPIYAADVVLLVGFALFCGQPAGALFALPLIVVLTQRFILPEERALDERFDTLFRAWKAEIPRWI